MPFKYKCYLAVAAILGLAWPIIEFLPFGGKVKAWTSTALIVIVFLDAFVLLAVHRRRQFVKSQSGRD